jgi:steroid delta-isomerase
MPSCKDTISAYFAATRAMNAEAFVSAFAPEAVSHDPVGAPPLNGHEQIRQFITGVMSGFEKVGLTEDHVFINGNSAAVKWTGRGRTRSGRDITFEGIDVLEFNHQGKIVLLRAFWDPAPVMAALHG